MGALRISPAANFHRKSLNIWIFEHLSSSSIKSIFLMAVYCFIYFLYFLMFVDVLQNMLRKEMSSRVINLYEDSHFSNKETEEELDKYCYGSSYSKAQPICFGIKIPLLVWRGFFPIMCFMFLSWINLGKILKYNKNSEVLGSLNFWCLRISPKIIQSRFLRVRSTLILNP